MELPLQQLETGWVPTERISNTRCRLLTNVFDYLKYPNHRQRNLKIGQQTNYFLNLILDNPVLPVTAWLR